MAAGSDDRGRYVPLIRCHACGKDILLDSFTYVNYTGNVTCEHCKAPLSVVIKSGTLESSSTARDPRQLEGIFEALEVIPWPQLADYLEAMRDLQNKCFKSAAVMCRRTIQGALLYKGVPDNRPSEMIRMAYEDKKLITRQLKGLGDSVVFFGASGAHPNDDLLQEVDELAATQGLLVTRRFLLYLFPPPPSPTQPTPPASQSGTGNNAPKA